MAPYGETEQEKAIIQEFGGLETWHRIGHVAGRLGFDLEGFFKRVKDANPSFSDLRNRRIRIDAVLYILRTDDTRIAPEVIEGWQRQRTFTKRGEVPPELAKLRDSLGSGPHDPAALAPVLEVSEAMLRKASAAGEFGELHGGGISVDSLIGWIQRRGVTLHQNWEVIEAYAKSRAATKRAPNVNLLTAAQRQRGEAERKQHADAAEAARVYISLLQRFDAPRDGDAAALLSVQKTLKLTDADVVADHRAIEQFRVASADFNSGAAARERMAAAREALAAARLELGQSEELKRLTAAVARAEAAIADLELIAEKSDRALRTLRELQTAHPRVIVAGPGDSPPMIHPAS